jgi:hypothetical protein
VELILSELHQHVLQHLQVLAWQFAARLVIIPGFRLAFRYSAEPFCRELTARVGCKYGLHVSMGNYVMSVEKSDPRDIAATY